MFLDVHRPWRQVKVTDQDCSDFAECMRDLVDDHYPDAEQIRVVLDNLSTHSAGALYEAFPAPEARRICAAGVPLHAEACQLAQHGRDRDRRAARASAWTAASTSAPASTREIAAWERERNAAGARITWMFTTERARDKMGRAYPKPTATLKQPAKES